MKLSTIMQIMNNYINQQKTNKDTIIKKLPTQTNQFVKNNTKNKNEKNIKNPSIKTRRKQRFIHKTNKNFEPKKLKSYSHNKKKENNQYHRNRSRIQPKQNINRTTCTDGYGNITKISDIHDRNLSAPYLKFQKNDETKMNSYKNIEKDRKNNIIKLKLRIRKDSDNQDNHVQLDYNSLKENHDNITINDDRLYQMTYNNDGKPVTSIFYKPKNVIENSENFPLTKKTLPEEENNYINIHKNVLNIKNFYKNINNNKRFNKKYKTKIDISAYNKDIEAIKNKKEIIALLKEQLKTKDNNNNDKPKLNKTLNTSNIINIDQINNNDPLSRNKMKKNYKSKKNVNVNKINKYILNDSNTKPKNGISDRQAYTSRENNTNMNLSNSSNNKNAKISTNVTNNNNGFGKNINLLSIYGRQEDKDKIKENNNIKKNNDLNNINQFNNEKTRNKNNLKKEKNFTKEDVINYKKSQLDDKIKNKDFSINNTISNNNNNNKNKKPNYIYLQRPKMANDTNYLTKNTNPIPLNIKNKNNYTLTDENRSKDKDKEKEKKIPQNKKINKKNQIYENHYNNRIIDTNSFNIKYNSINSERYNNFNDTHKKRNEENNKIDNLSFDNINRNKGDISKNNNDLKKTKNANSQLKKIISYKPNFPRNRSVEKGPHEKMNISSPVKRHLTNCDFKNKSIHKIGVVCKAGEVVFGQRKVNQDNYFNYLINDDIRFIGVCDGHGDYGEYVSKYLRENLPKALEQSFKDLLERGYSNINILQKEFSGFSNNKINIETNDNLGNNDKNINDNNIFEIIKGIFENTFLKTDRNLSLYCHDLNNKKNISDKNDKKIFNVEYSGSTCASILLKEKNINKIYMGNVGDSRVIIIKELKNKNNDWVPYQLTRDHKPTEEDEAQRVLEYDGEIEKIEDEYGNWTGPLRVWVKGSDGPGLAMTRSFGDEVGTSVGVFSLPEVTEYKIKEEDRAIIIASDGLWEYMDNKKVTDIVRKLIKQKDPDIIANKLYKESIIEWKKNDQGIDDITIICILLKST